MLVDADGSTHALLCMRACICSCAHDAHRRAQAAFRENVGLMRELLEREERLGAGAASVATAEAEAAAAARAERDGSSPEDSKNRGASSSSGGWTPRMPDMAAMMADPAVLACLEDPSVLAKMQEVLQDPDAMLKHGNDPKIVKLIETIWGSQWQEELARRNAAGGGSAPEGR